MERKDEIDDGWPWRGRVIDWRGCIDISRGFVAVRMANRMPITVASFALDITSPIIVVGSCGQ
jgi:hypothetical protein